MRRKAAGLIACALVLAGALAACTSQKHSASSGLSDGVGGSAAGANGSGGGSAAQPAVGAPDGTASKPGTGFDAAAVSAPGPSVIRTADITVATSSVGSQADQARRIVTDVGGSVDGDDRTSGVDPSATMTLRAPPDQLGAMLTKLSALGKERSRHSSTRDVTTQVADVDSRVRSAVAAIAQLRDLYGKATRVADIIVIETELSQRESDLESLQAQQRALAGQVAMATITLYLVSTPAPVHHAASHRGFIGGLTNGWHAFTRAAAVLVTGIGAALPFVIVAAVAGAIWLIMRRRRPTNTPPPTAEPVS